MFRRRSLHVVIVLMVFYPLGVYIFTQSVNRSTAEDIVLKNIDAGLAYCVEVKAKLEELLAATEDSPFASEDPVQRLLDEAGPGGVERGAFRWVFQPDEAAATLVRFAEVYAGEKRILHWGEEPPGRLLAEVELSYPLDLQAARERVFNATARGTTSGVCRITVPVELGGKRPGRLAVGLMSTNIGAQLAALSERLSMRALRLSLVGTSLLALLAAYIVYLNDRTRELELRLEEEKRLAYVGTIAAGMAHEIRNPLNSVKMNIQMIEQHLSDFGRKEGDYFATKIARILHETARLEESVNNFLAFARPKPLQREWTDLNEAVDHVVEFLEPSCRNDGIRIVRDYSPDLPPAYVDPEQLGQAVENLVRNAHQAIGRDGIIEVYTGRHGDWFEIRVSDDGPGVPPEARDKLFEIFFTTKEAGSGLGLTIVKQIAEAHGGGVDFDTIEKRGATFTLRLPVNEPP